MALIKRSLLGLLICLALAWFVLAQEEVPEDSTDEIDQVEDDDEGYDLNDEMFEGEEGDEEMDFDETEGEGSIDEEADSSSEPTDGALYKTDKNVIVLNGKNFDTVVTSEPLLLVEFYAPWCGHCKALAPKYAAAAKELQDHDPPLHIAKLDAANEKNRALAEKYEIKGFPTLLLFRNNTLASSTINYGGARTTEGIVDYMKKKYQPVNEVTNKEQFIALLNTNEVVAMFYVAADNKDKEAFRTKVYNLAVADDNVAYGITTEASLFEEKDQKSIKKTGLILFKTFDEGKNVYTETEIDMKKVQAFILENKMPQVVTYTEEKAASIFGGSIQSHFLIFSDDSKPYHETLINSVKEASKLNKKEIIHIYIPNSETNILKHFNLENENLPAIVLVHLGQTMQKYPYPVEGAELLEILNTPEKVKGLEKELIAFEKQYLAGELKVTLNSQEPIDDSQDAVKTIVGKEFEERVMQSDQDVLLEFYAPWCGHCKSLAPKYEKLAEQLTEVKSIMVAKIDYTENQIEHSGVDIQGFPTILLFANGRKDKPILFQGAKRDENSLLTFLQTNANPFTFKGKQYGTDGSTDASAKQEKESVEQDDVKTEETKHEEL